MIRQATSFIGAQMQKTSSGKRRPFSRGIVLLCALIALLAAAQSAFAAPSPFGVGRPEGAGSAGGWMGWVLSETGRFYQGLSTALRSWKSSGSAGWTLVGLSFAYGVFHAALPGHGKIVISAYLFATGETLKRGIGLAFMSAMIQALSAIALVGILALVFKATAATMDAATLVLERASYAAIAALGLWLVWRKARRLWVRRAGGSAAHPHHHHGADCNHMPLPPAKGADGPRSALGTALAVGLRPCSGAVFVLVFALAQGIFLAGVASVFAMALGTAATVAAIACLAVGAKSFAARLVAAESRAGIFMVGGIELAAALLVLALGLTFLAGSYWQATQRFV